MEEAAKSNLDTLVAKDSWTSDDHKDLLKLLYDLNDAPRKFRQILAELEAANPEPKGAAALKIGIARSMLCRFNDAIRALAEATDNKERRFYQAMCYKNLRQYDKAIEDFDRAKDRGWDSPAIDLQLAEVKALAGELDAARKALGKLEKHSGTADYQYVLGLVEELAGFGAKAVAAYEKARQLDANHSPAAFRLAYYYDLHGEEDKAIELYRTCTNHPPVYANALLNLAILYEDMGRYEQAILCVKRILATNPNHARARLLLKDAEASKSMFYDEDMAKRTARRNAVLDIPVTDFELSVRARNCLKKMNVHSLGDLVRTSEPELLAYKNFGETSLKEIKDMLTAKGLRLGQGVEGEGEVPDILSFVTAPPPEQPKVEGVAATPIGQIELSIRARKALETLKIQTLGDFAQMSEADLLGCKNFGQTSLNEIVQRLSEYGLRLKEPD